MIVVNEEDSMQHELVEHMLTTVDNPFDPHTHFKEWYAYDLQLGYNTCSFLARVVRSAPSLSDPDQHLAVETAIDEIVRENVLGLYRKITRNDPIFKTNRVDSK